MDAQIQQMFDDAKRIVFLTGAGVSTASGIPDFRSANGLYTQDKNAEYYLSHRYFSSDPEGFYEFCKKNLYFPDAKPNVIHQKQAALTNQDRATVITQNIDNLYEEAGATHLIDFHGNLYHVYCEQCGETVPVADYLKSRLHEKDGGPLRPDIVLYDEGIKQDDIMNSVRALQAADLVVIVGTSMKVYPFAGLLEYRNRDAQVLAINQQELHLPCDFTMVQTDATKFFDELRV
ncbi:NAD-dependent protein deacylase [Limosilactobacillus pontis]|uniref:protein acetyllysine N-acetyltransferase n=1 Tax=Limosilactobacillus pontis DSM 8475 TaxID=1423794 RepID=A0A922TNV5_9LACO|nr:NAD-dependent protein deacylase [Limosilactobacillus pontis]KRM37389.1 NAD-dependent deacetylase [Limosilactobacillus pontis DSM 8475]QFV00433.1 NAD-dependent protein deacylase [Limosilactobacillus pontis]HJE26750.1 NAD-dependent protein deacylase [Limosilactobacillus pontis]